MDGVFTRCPSRDYETGRRCVRIEGHDDDHMNPRGSSWSDE